MKKTTYTSLLRKCLTLHNITEDKAEKIIEYSTKTFFASFIDDEQNEIQAMQFISETMYYASLDKHGFCLDLNEVNRILTSFIVRKLEALENVRWVDQMEFISNNKPVPDWYKTEGYYDFSCTPKLVWKQGDKSINQI